MSAKLAWKLNTVMLTTWLGYMQYVLDVQQTWVL